MISDLRSALRQIGILLPLRRSRRPVLYRKHSYFSFINPAPAETNTVGKYYIGHHDMR